MVKQRQPSPEEPRSGIFKPPSTNNSGPSPTRRKKLLFRHRLPGILRAVFDYLVSDSFMYGPLLSNPPLRKKALASATRFFVPPSEDGRPSIAPLEPPATPSSGIHSICTFSKRVVYRSPDAASAHEEETPTSASGFLRRIVKEPASKVRDEVGSDSDAEEYMEQCGNQFTPLQKEAAVEVACKLVKKVGGCFSKDLGIFVENNDAEVEKWFLLTTILSYPPDIERAKLMFKKLQIMRISKIKDVLAVSRSELQEAFEDVFRNQRMASHLIKISNAMPNGVCYLKHISSYPELKRELENLPGYNKHAAQLFLREMRGVWSTSTPEIDARVKNAAKHLHLIPSIKLHDSDVTSSLHSLAQDGGLDVRDFEMALLKLSMHHSRKYRNCNGGSDCEFLRTIRSILVV